MGVKLVPTWDPSHLREKVREERERDETRTEYIQTYTTHTLCQTHTGEIYTKCDEREERTQDSDMKCEER